MHWIGGSNIVFGVVLWSLWKVITQNVLAGIVACIALSMLDYTARYQQIAPYKKEQPMEHVVTLVLGLIVVTMIAVGALANANSKQMGVMWYSVFQAVTIFTVSYEIITIIPIIYHSFRAQWYEGNK